MKVMCIESIWIKNGEKHNIGPSYGEVCVVIGSAEEPYGPVYRLDEYPGIYYAKRCFIPLSDIDETEMIRERQTAEA